MVYCLQLFIENEVIKAGTSLLIEAIISVVSENKQWLS